MKWILKFIFGKHLILLKTDKKTVFFDINGNKWGAFKR